MQHIGKYKIIKKLGSGSFGFVYLAEDPKLQMQVAIKVFKIKDTTLMSQVTSATEDPEHVIKQRFINEARTLRKLSANPYIVEMYEFDELADGTPYYVMPYIARTLVDEIGKDAFNQGMLDEIPKANFPRRIPTILAISYLKQLSQALCTVHENGLVHRDIKPENILINNENQLQLSDFGIAKLPLSEHSQTGFGMGSKNYLSPEQQESAKHVQAASDIYSLGVIAYRMLTGQLPLGRFQDPINYAPDIPKALNDLIISALSQTPSLRPSDGSQFLIALNQAINDTSKKTVAPATQTEEGTAIWTTSSVSKIKDELIPLKNKIIELLTQQGEIKPDDLILLQTLADIAHVDNSALHVFIAKITLQQTTQQPISDDIISSDLTNNKDDSLDDLSNNVASTSINNSASINNSSSELAAFILWMNTVNKHFNNHEQFLSDQQVNHLITAGLSTTNKTAEQLKVLIDTKQQKPNLIKKIKTRTFLLFNQIKKRPPLLLLLLTVAVLTITYGQYQAQNKLTITDEQHWSQAQKTNTIAAYQLYLTSQPEGNHFDNAKQALAKLLQQKEYSEQYSKENKAIERQQQIEAIQQQLIKQGYQISQTGKLDERTKHAIKTFEKSQNLLITGEVDELILKKLKQTYQQKDQKRWLSAQDKNTIDAYQQYKKAFPQGQYFMQATQEINQLTFEKDNNHKKVKEAQKKRDKKIIALATNELLNNMVTLPSANFMMGCTLSDECKTKEMPQHNVSINTFSIMAAEVTFTQWDACVTDGACSLQPDDEGWGRGNRPVIGVSYLNITEQFIPWLYRVTGKNFTLPSEAQWEYAAKATSTTKYAWGNELTCLQARYSQFSGICGNDRNTEIVKSFKPNTFGLYDMHGNVWEWTQDCWSDNYNASPTDGSAREISDCTAGVIRGGSWLNEASLLRSTFRTKYSRSAKANVNGFRLVINTTNNRIY